MSDDDPVADEARRIRLRQQWLSELAWPVRWQLRQASVGMVIAGMLLVAQAGLIAGTLQLVLVQRQMPEELLAFFALLVLMLIMRAGLGWWAQRKLGEVAESAKQMLRTRLYRSLYSAGPLWLRQRRSGELSELMTTHGDALDGYFSGYLPTRAEVLWVPLAIFAAVLWVDWIVALLLLFTAPLIPFFMMLVGWGAEAASRRQLRALALLGGQFADRLKGLGLIRLYGRGDDELHGIASAADGVRERTLKVLRIAFLSSAVLEFFASVSVALIALYLGMSYLGLISLRTLPPSLGAGMFCLLLAPEFYAPLRRLAAHYHDRAGALAAAAEIERHLGELPDEAPDDRAIAVAQDGARQVPLAGIELERVCLRPLGADRDVLDGLRLRLEHGERLALVGPSGCGKSTLLEALAGWLPPRSGRVMVSPGMRISHAGQRPYLFHGSLADNLLLADPAATRMQLLTAAEAAQVMRFAQRMPDGLDTMIGERGFGLSGGEARRVGLARALLRDPQLLLLDEPTAFLDADTETALLAALDSFAQGRTVVVATHSPAVMAWAGQVLELPAGILHPYSAPRAGEPR